MLKRGTGLVLLIYLMAGTAAQAQSNSGKILPKLKVQSAQSDIRQPTFTAPKRPPIILHVTRTLPIMRSASTPPDNDNDPDEINPLYSKSPLTIIKEKNTPQGLDIEFVGSAETPEVPDPEPAIATDGPTPANESPLGSGENYHDPTINNTVDTETGYNPNDVYPYQASPGGYGSGFYPGGWAGGWAGGTDMLPSYIHEVPGWGFNFVGATPAISQTRGSGNRRDPDPYDTGDNYSSGDIYDHMLYPQQYP